MQFEHLIRQRRGSFGGNSKAGYCAELIGTQALKILSGGNRQRKVSVFVCHRRVRHGQAAGVVKEAAIAC